jgi:hypothetical protein
LKVI